MRHKIGRNAFAVLCLSVVLVGIPAVGVSQKAQTAVAHSQQELGQEAMNYIASRFVFDKAALAPHTKKPLSGQGNWSVSTITPAGCPKINSPCVLVSYAEPGTSVVCQWTVLLRGGVDRDFLLDLNEDAARYLTENPDQKKTWVGGILGGHALKCTKPLYSKDLKLPRTRGIVKLLVRYDETGHPTEVKALSGLQVLQDLASEAYRQCVYTPLKIDGVPISFGNLRVIDYDEFN